jgi:hypothetical protein
VYKRADGVHLDYLNLLKIACMGKYLLLTTTLFFSFFAAAAQATVEENGPEITFEKKNYDFGDIAQGDKVEHTFTFTNTGNEPLIITNVEVTCGCTVPKGWPRDPVLPGGKGEITVSFSTVGKIGRQNKPIVIISNASNVDGNRLSFTANILEKSAMSTNPQ